MKSRSLSKWTASILIPLLVLSALLAYSIEHTIVRGDKQILSTLASVQAAIFAIVFSVVILGIQLSSSRYSPRVVDIFRHNSEYKLTIGLFGTSIGFDVLGLYLFGTAENIWFNLHLYLAGSLAVTAVAVLYIFVDQTLEQSTPEGILHSVHENLTPETIQQKARNSQEDLSEPDPYYLPISIIESALADRDLPTVTLGLNIISENVGQLLSSRLDSVDDPHSATGNSIENLCADRLSRLIEHSVDEEQSDISEEIIDCLDSIFSEGIENRTEYVVQASAEGLARPISSLEYSALEDRVRKNAVSTAYGCLKESADERLWVATANGTRILASESAYSIRNRPEHRRKDAGYEELLLQGIPKIHSIAVDEVSNQIDETNIDWVRAQGPGTRDLYPEEQILRDCYVGMCDVTSAIIRDEIDTGQSLIRWNFVEAGWSECVESLSDTNLNSLHQIWLGTVLYLGYLDFETKSDRLARFWSITNNSDPSAMVNTIDAILSDEIDPRAGIDFVPGVTDPLETPPLTGIRQPPISDPSITFKEWVKYIRATYSS